ncbi:Pyridoxal reductase [Grifola frondosa]|uniref:Pyridoxal reductase n=1 Tax=Grifola frondosa TaxID=5627 RepID=A0A1C7MLF6_GRIFR|nr:Pyridoxal reductase [Grifola frondosa]
MIHHTVNLGGTAKDITVGKVAHGLMMMTWRDPKYPLPDQEAFEAIKAGVDALPPGAKMFINSGEFYGPNLSTANLELLARFFEKYPEYAERTFLSVKGGIKPGTLSPDSSLENLRRSVDLINATLRGTKKMDLFEPARVDTNISIEDAMKNLVQLIKEHKFDHIGLSECSADTLGRANAVYPIAAVEIEVSLWSYEQETKRVLATAQELGIAVAAYAPLGRGFLTGSIKSPDDITEGDIRKRFTRFKAENFKHNMAIVDDIRVLAEKRNITPAQLSIAWIGGLGPQVIPMPGSSNKKRTLENSAAGDIELCQDDLVEVASILAKHEIKGDRYTGADPKVLHLWG